MHSFIWHLGVFRLLDWSRDSIEGTERIIITMHFKCPFQATGVEHENHVVGCRCYRCQRGEKPVIQKNERTNALLEEMKKTKKFQTKN